MTGLVWDQVGDRRYETGVDRGVLFLPDGRVVPWNGLTSVTENLGREVKGYFIDGIQYLAHQVPGSYSAKLQAFTYPDELDELLGIAEFQAGVSIHDQRAKMFHMSYRTLIGNDMSGTDYAYKIHILWNVLATMSDRTYNSLSDTLSPTPFEWNLVGVPSLMFGQRPTSHISIDSRHVPEGLLRDVELYLYGDETSDPGLPGTVDFLGFLEFWNPDVIIS